jgi:catechol 2,3-dioxygenase-like lactoylglutathione lyase family enzyme
MAKIRHITLTIENPDQAAAFYKAAFDMQEAGRNERRVLLSDGYINLTILRWKTEKDADVRPHSPNYIGIHHIGFQVDDLNTVCDKLERAKGESIAIREGLDPSTAAPRRQRAEMKWAGPHRVVIDISQPRWVVN